MSVLRKVKHSSEQCEQSLGPLFEIAAILHNLQPRAHAANTDDVFLFRKVRQTNKNHSHLRAEALLLSHY